ARWVFSSSSCESSRSSVSRTPPTATAGTTWRPLSYAGRPNAPGTAQKAQGRLCDSNLTLSPSAALKGRWPRIPSGWCAKPATERISGDPSAEPSRVKLLLGLPLELWPVDLSRGVQRHLVEEDDLLRSLVAHPRSREHDELVGARARASSRSVT